MKIRKMKNKELKKVKGQCCCTVKEKPAVYEPGSCCFDDCNTWGKPSSYVSTAH